VLMLLGFLAVNHVGTLIFKGAPPATYAFEFQVLVIWLPFLVMVTTVMRKPAKMFRGRGPIDFFSMWVSLLSLWSFLFFSVLWSHDLRSPHLFFLLWAPTLLLSLMLLVVFLRMTGEEFEYLLKAPTRMPNYARTFRRAVLLFLGLTVASLGLELFRGLWLFAVLGCASLVFLATTAALVYRFLFMPLPPQIDKPSVFHFPLSYAPLILVLASFFLWLPLYMTLAARYGEFGR
jgi:hypothetical protein